MRYKLTTKSNLRFNEQSIQRDTKYYRDVTATRGENKSNNNNNNNNNNNYNCYYNHLIIINQANAAPRSALNGAPLTKPYWTERGTAQSKYMYACM
jgi:hypothetical protein